MKIKVLSNQWIPEDWLVQYQDRFEFTMPDRTTLIKKPEMTIKQIKEFDVYYNFVYNAGKELLDAGENIKIIANFGAGYDNIDIAYATTKGFPVLNTGNALTDTVAELGISMMAASMRYLNSFDKQIKDGKFSQVLTFTFEDTQTTIGGSKLGLVGFGKIGKATCEKAQGLGMEVLYSDPYRASKETEEAYDVQYKSFDELLAESDAIIITAAYTPENHHLFSNESISKMKKGSFLFNIARGGFVDEAALVLALKSGHLKGAGLDVFEFEPQVNPELFEMDNVILTPHVASRTLKTRRAMFEEGMDGIVQYFEGKRPNNIVNPSVISETNFKLDIY